ncbi:hypothetical protein RFI_38125, partial [Reticulomyxa filosa]
FDVSFTENISVLISDIKYVNQKQLEAFQKFKFYLFEWKQDLKNMELIFQTKEPTLRNEKEERLRLLLHILGTSNQGIIKECEEKKVEVTENLHDQIVEKLCKDEEWSNYVLTFDNILKM